MPSTLVDQIEPNHDGFQSWSHSLTVPADYSCSVVGSKLCGTSWAEDLTDTLYIALAALGCKRGRASQVVACTYATAEVSAVAALTYWIMLNTLDLGVRNLEPRGNHYGPKGSGMRWRLFSALSAADIAMLFNGFPALDRVSLTVGCGRSFGFLGPSGSGKSTFLRALS